MSALTEAAWYELRLGHIEVAVHPDVFRKEADPRTDQDLQRAILIMLGAAVGKHGLRWRNAERARLRRPTQDERLVLLELVQRDREADGSALPIKERQGLARHPRVYDFVLELDYCRRPPHRSRGHKATKPLSETAFFGILWPEGDGQSMVYILPTEEVEPETEEPTSHSRPVGLWF